MIQCNIHHVSVALARLISFDIVGTQHLRRHHLIRLVLLYSIVFAACPTKESKPCELIESHPYRAKHFVKLVIIDGYLLSFFYFFKLIVQ